MRCIRSRSRFRTARYGVVATMARGSLRSRRRLAAGDGEFGRHPVLGRDILNLGTAHAVARVWCSLRRTPTLRAPDGARNLRLGFHRLAGSRDRGALFRQRLDYVYSLFPILLSVLATLGEHERRRSGCLRSGAADGGSEVAAAGRTLAGARADGCRSDIEILATLRKDGLTICSWSDPETRRSNWLTLATCFRRTFAPKDQRDVRDDPAVRHSYWGSRRRAEAGPARNPSLMFSGRGNAAVYADRLTGKLRGLWVARNTIRAAKSSG